MYFFEDGPLRGLERMMQGIPNFSPRGHGVVVLYEHGPASDRGWHPGGSAWEDFLKGAARIRCPPFARRLEQYLKESEGNRMEFKNEKHRAAFYEAASQAGGKDHALLAALYLLSADHRLWAAARRCISAGRISFGQIRLKGSTREGYALYCAVKDLYFGTKCITLKELADPTLVAPKTFAFILNGMAVRRFGMQAVSKGRDVRNGGCDG